jgi:POT family proton-dependent oligopeptide transporter
MGMMDGLDKIRKGFHRTFWVANGMELFERLAYYGQATVLSLYLRNTLKFNEIESGQLSSIFGGLLYLLPVFAGTLADKFGFRKAFSIAFSILAIGYFLIGSMGMNAFAGFYSGMSQFGTMTVILIFTAIGGSFIKPSVLGTVAVTSKPETKSLGFAVYYWLVNIGGAIGPLFAFMVRDTFGLGMQFVYVVSAVSCALMLFVNLLFYKEVRDESRELTESLGAKMKNLIVVLGNGKFMLFLLIFSLYWVMFWQIFIIVPYFVTDFISKDAPFELIQSADAWAIIALQLVVNTLTKKLSPQRAIIGGFFVSSLSWLIIALHPTVWSIVAGLVVFSIGEMTLAPRYYEYISDLAPKGQQGLFQGYAFLPIAIAWGFGGTFGGWLYTHYAKQSDTPNMVWFALFGVGMLATVLMTIYNRFIAIQEKKKA